MRFLLTCSFVFATALGACGGDVDDTPSETDTGTDGSSDAGTEDAAESGPDAEAEGVPPGFMDPVADNALLIELKGRINTYEDYSDPMAATEAKADFKAVLTSGVIQMPDQPIAFLYEYPDEPDVPEQLRGQQIIVLQAYHTDPASTHAHGKYVMGQTILRRDAFEKLLTDATSTLGFDDIASATVRSVDSIVRVDTTRLVKDCYVALRDPDNTDSSLFVDATENTAFAAGEVLTTWANIGLLADATSIATLAPPDYESHDGTWCFCAMNDAQVPCVEWEQEATKTGAELSCPIPSDFFDNPAESHVTFTFKGELTGPGEDTAQGSGVFDVVQDGTHVPIDYMSYAGRYTLTSGTYAGQDIIDIIGLGNVKSAGTGRYTLTYLGAQVLVGGLEDLESSGEHLMNLDPQHIYFVVLHDTELVSGPPEYIRYCPVAVLDSHGTPSAMYVCHENNTSFAVGETIEIAGNLPLTSDPAAIGELTGGHDCFCSKDGASIACEDFPSP
jgi:hypothetical protein